MVETAVKAPGPLDAAAASAFRRRTAAAVAIDAAQIAQILRRNAKLIHHARELVLEVGGVGELLPFESSAKQQEAILAGTLGDVQAVAGHFEDRAERTLHIGRQSERHGEGLALRAREIL